LLVAVLTLSSYPSEIDIDNRTGKGENIPAPDGVFAAPPLDVDVVAAVEEPSLDVDVPAVLSPPEDALLVTATRSSAASCRGTPEDRRGVAVLENEVSLEIDIVILIGRGVCRNDNRTGEGENISAPDGVVAAPSLDVDVVAAVEEPSLDVDVPAAVSSSEDALLVTATCSSAAGAEDP